MTIHEKGLIGIVSASMGRYREFDICLNALQKPTSDTITSWKISMNTARGLNDLCRQVVEDPSLKWLWIMNDDHVFNSDLLIKLLERNVDIVIPLCLRRTEPYTPVIHDFVEDDNKNNFAWEKIKGKSGLLEVAANGNAGMLIKRNVIDAIKDDWHAVGQFHKELGSSDLYFCKKAKDHNFKIHVDLDNRLGHIMHHAIWPKRDRNNNYSMSINPAHKLPTKEFLNS